MTSTRVLLGWLEEGSHPGQVHFDGKRQCWQVLGYPEPNAVIAELLGAPSPTRRCSGRGPTWCWALSVDTIGEVGEQSLASVAPTMREMDAYFLDHSGSAGSPPPRT